MKHDPNGFYKYLIQTEQNKKTSIYKIEYMIVYFYTILE